MKATFNDIEVKDFNVLGRYGKLYHNQAIYRHTLKTLSVEVKRNKPRAISKAAYMLSSLISPNSLIIPIPQSDGRADYTLKLANCIKKLRNDCNVADVLYGTPHEKLYIIKKTNPNLEGIDFSYEVNISETEKENLKNYNNVYLLDNVINTGYTFKQARKALKECADIEPSLLAISATKNWF